jgi:hypothetical protein
MKCASEVKVQAVAGLLMMSSFTFRKFPPGGLALPTYMPLITSSEPSLENSAPEAM